MSTGLYVIFVLVVVSGFTVSNCLSACNKVQLAIVIDGFVSDLLV